MEVQVVELGELHEAFDEGRRVACRACRRQLRLRHGRAVRRRFVLDDESLARVFAMFGIIGRLARARDKDRTGCRDDRSTSAATVE